MSQIEKRPIEEMEDDEVLRELFPEEVVTKAKREAEEAAKRAERASKKPKKTDRCD